MVVTRKAPLPPVPSSRSSSSQAVPRMAKVKANQLNQPGHSSPLANGKSKTTDSTDSTTALKLKPKSKWRRKSTPKPKKGIFRRFINFVFKISLAWLAAYSFFICQNSDKSPNSSICHTISATRYNILEPYAYPLIKRTLSYPAIEPYVKEIEPYVIRVHHVLQPLAATTISKFSTHVVPEWNDRIVPQYHAYVAPHVQNVLSYLDPHLAVVRTEYERYLAPYLRASAATAWKLQEQVQPYVILAWYKSVDGYRYVKPYARPAWDRFKDAVLRILAYLAVYRRRFVDPHVAQMWAKIKELSGDKVVPTTPEPAITPEPVPTADSPAEESSTVAIISAEEDTYSPVPVSTPTPPPTLNNDGKLSPETPRVTTATPGVVNIMGDGPTDPVDITVLVEPNVSPPQEEEPQISIVVASANQKPVPAMPPVEETPTSTPTRAPKQAIPITPEDEDDLYSFSTEIGLDLDEPEDVPVVEEGVPLTPPEESDEEREARLKAKAEETAWKRKEITDRHTDWEYQLEDLKREQMEIFKLALHNVRRNAAKGLKKDSDVQRAIDELAADGDKYLRGAENYLKNLIKEKKKQDKSALWERVAQKVKDKFEKRLDEADRKVGDWYNVIAANEEKLVEKATTAVAELAEKAQADIGLDYSWLDDVTTDDWVRYHDLMRSSDSFRSEFCLPTFSRLTFITSTLCLPVHLYEHIG
ncbi:hypothetical protein BDM02DRAFT_1514412 [Thelephora ganbajun]|uniref:Uncharacterized protein n=1 Tax=Thelephora ganbajun TaxID=370292 RepID=A0ACB6ZKH6_THEGA|nr:hypothetical protein BDM02DRAFT_1514412 [Thelephora ganbajun]